MYKPVPTYRRGVLPLLFLYSQNDTGSRKMTQATTHDV